MCVVNPMVNTPWYYGTFKFLEFLDEVSIVCGMVGWLVVGVVSVPELDQVFFLGVLWMIPTMSQQPP